MGPPAWSAPLAPVPDHVRLLHRDSTHGYTDNPARAVPREPEAIPTAYQHQLTARVERDRREAELAEWRTRRAIIERQVEWLYSQRNHREVGSDMRALKRQLDRIDQKLTSAN